MIKTDSPIYQLFLSLFFKDGEEYPLVVPCPSPGQAISLAQKLNQCRKQHIGDAPAEICPFSAKAQESSVIISARASRNRGASWIQELAHQHGESNMHMHAPVHTSTEPGTPPQYIPGQYITSGEYPESPDTQDALLAKWYQGKE